MSLQYRYINIQYGKVRLLHIEVIKGSVPLGGEALSSCFYLGFHVFPHNYPGVYPLFRALLRLSIYSLTPLNQVLIIKT